MFRKVVFILVISAGLLIGLSGCARAGSSNPATGKIRVVATTTLVADVVGRISGDLVEVSVLLPVGADPHTYEATPQDAAKLAEAQLVFANGAGLEEFLTPLLKNAGGQAEVISVSDGIELLEAEEHLDEAGHTGEEENGHTAGDPHTWFDPNNVILWAENIEKTLSALDPENSQLYAANSEKYRGELSDLDAWIRQQVAQIPEEDRKLVADHTSFTYFAARYGFEQVGAVIPSYSTLSQPSAQELAKLEDAIRDLGVKAIFVEQSVNPSLAQRVAQDTGIKLVPLYNGSLSGPDGPAATYIDFMRYNVGEITRALK
jgi:ABC-type Zn uptake system ZnuABC Zn-binding protein ZnuA